MPRGQVGYYQRGSPVVELDTNRSNNFISWCGHHSSLLAIAGLPHIVVVKASEKVEQVVVVESPYNEAAVVVEMSDKEK